MGDTDPPPSLEELADGDENYWLETTTISVSRITKERLDYHRDGRPWDEWLEQLRREHADPLTINDVEELAERLGISDNYDADELRQMKSALETVEARTGRIEQMLEGLQG